MEFCLYNDKKIFAKDVANDGVYSWEIKIAAQNGELSCCFCKSKVASFKNGLEKTPHFAHEKESKKVCPYYYKTDKSVIRQTKQSHVNQSKTLTVNFESNYKKYHQLLSTNNESIEPKHEFRSRYKDEELKFFESNRGKYPLTMSEIKLQAKKYFNGTADMRSNIRLLLNAGICCIETRKNILLVCEESESNDSLFYGKFSFQFSELINRLKR